MSITYSDGYGQKLWVCVCVSRSVTSNSATTWPVACKAPWSMNYSRKEYCSGLPFPSPGNFPDPGIDPNSPRLWADSSLSEPPEKPKNISVQFSSVAQLCPTLYDPMDCSLTGSSVHGIFQARVLNWVAISYSNTDVYICVYLFPYQYP